MLREIPPTAGLPLTTGDLFYRASEGELERSLANFLSVDSVQIECSGTAALVIALTALRKLSNREVVIVQGYTCPLVVIAVAQAGLRCRVVDTDELCLGFDSDALKSALREDILAVIVTDIGGIPGDLATIQHMAEEQGAFVIEDVAQALGATRKGVACGTTCDVGMFSLTVGKGLTIYQGGFLSAKTTRIAEAIAAAGNEMRKHDLKLESLRLAQLVGCVGLYNPLGCSLVYGIPLRQAIAANKFDTACGDVFDLQTEVMEVGTARKAIGASAARRLTRFISDNRSRAHERLDRLRDIPGVKVIEPDRDDEGSWPFFTLFFDDQFKCDSSLIPLWTQGVGVTRLFSRALIDYEYLRPLIAEPGDTPHARSFAGRTLTISNSHWLEDTDLDKILSIIAGK